MVCEWLAFCCSIQLVIANRKCLCRRCWYATTLITSSSLPVFDHCFCYCGRVVTHLLHVSAQMLTLSPVVQVRRPQSVANEWALFNTCHSSGHFGGGATIHSHCFCFYHCMLSSACCICSCIIIILTHMTWSPSSIVCRLKRGDTLWMGMQREVCNLDCVRVCVLSLWQSCNFDCAVFCPNIQRLSGRRSEGV